MADEILAVKKVLQQFINELATLQVDWRAAIVTYGATIELSIDFTQSVSDLEAVLGEIDVQMQVRFHPLHCGHCNFARRSRTHVVAAAAFVVAARSRSRRRRTS